MAAVTSRIRNCCNQCAHSKIRCDSKRPICLNCRRRERSCTYSYVRQSGRPRRIRSSSHAEEATSQGQETARKPSNSISTGQHCPSSATDAPPLSPDMTLGTTSSSQSRSEHTQLFLDGDEIDPDRLTSAPVVDMGPESVGLDFLDWLDIPHMQQPISADDFDLRAMETDFSIIDTDLGMHDHHPHKDSSYTSIDPSLAMSNQSTRSTSSPSGYSQLESGLQGLLDDSMVSRIVDSMMDSQLQDGPFACVTESRQQSLNTTANDGSEHEKTCRCHTMLSKLYVIVMDPKLSQTTRLLPLDLVLFLEEALQNTVETMKHCTVCGSSSLSSGSGITLCIAGNWIVSTLRAILESELNVRASRSSSHGLWGEGNRVETGAPVQRHNDGSTSAAAVPPSMDSRNCLRVGTWGTSSETWALCVSAILVRRIKRLQRVLSTVGTTSAETSLTAKAEQEMAKDIRAKADMLLGMVEAWVTQRHLR